jgi:hypothetical protein
MVLITAEALLSRIGLGELVRLPPAPAELATCSFLLWTAAETRAVDRRFAVLGPGAG